jgi:hypothetical protein
VSLFTELERRVLAADDRTIDRVYARRDLGLRWRIPRPPVAEKTCPHGVGVSIDCKACPVWRAA